MPEREVKFRATLEKGGDTEALKEIRQDSDDAGQSFEKTGLTADEFSTRLAAIAGKGMAGWEDMLRLVSEVDDELAELLSTPEAAIDLGLTKATQDLETFTDAVANASGDIPGFGTRARISLDQITAASKRLKREGHGLTDEQEAELRELEDAYKDVIRMQGEYQAKQAEVRSEISRSASRAGDYTAGVHSIGDALGALNPKAARAASSLGALTGGFKDGWDIGRGFMDFLGQVDRELGTKFVPAINEGVKSFFHMQKRMDAIVGVAPSVGEEADELRNTLHQLNALGIEPVSGELEELRKQLEKVRKEKARDSAETERATKRYQEWLKSLKLSGEVLRQQSAELTGNLQRYFEEAGDDIDWLAVSERFQDPLLDALQNFSVQGLEPPPELLDAVHEMVDRIEDAFASAAAESDTGTLSGAAEAQLQALLKVYDGAPDEVRERMKEIAEAHGALPDGAAKHFDAIRGQMQRYQNEVLGLAGLLEKSLDGGEQQLAALQAAVEGLDPDAIDRQIANLTEKQAEELREKVKQHIEGVRDMGGDYTTAIQELATKLGLMIAPWDHVTESARHASDAVDEGSSSLDRTSRSAKQTAEEFRDLAEAQGESSQEADSNASRQDQAGQSYKKAGEGAAAGAEGIREQADAVEDLGEAYAGSSATADAFDSSQRKVLDGSKSLVEDLSGTQEVVKGIGAGWGEAAEKISSAKALILGDLNEIKAEIVAVRTEAKGLAADLAALHAASGSESGGDGAASAAPAPAGGAVVV